ncbi:MAG TPA: class I adenylate-forming enzyme family protein [Acetobacteraceae bacterium]|nr:class I adenylate-forming enzyme family protein [Acetobacteraceae bacterium]
MQPPYSRTLFELLDEQASRRPETIAAIAGAEALTWRALTGRARQAAAILRGHGVRRGDRVGLLINNRLEWVEVAFGAWLLGAVVAPFSTWSTRRELEYLLVDSEIRTLVALARFAREDYAAMLRALAPGRGIAVLLIGGDGGFPEYAAARDAATSLPTPAPGEGASASDDAIILYTSGSTSRPKAIVLAHYLVVENGFNIGERQGLGPDDTVLLSPPLFWAYGGINALPAAFSHGATLVLQGRFDPGEALDLIERHRCTSIYTLPGMTDALVRHPEFRPERTRSLRTGLTIGSPQDVIKAVETLGAAELCNVYGSSETGGNCCVTHHDWPLERRANCQGQPLPGVQLRITDEATGAVRGPGEPGQVEVRGPYVTRGYVGDSARHNASAFTADGWFRTGDIGQLTEAGEFVFLGRSAEMIKRAGINVSPAEVEEVLMQHPAVAQAGVVGVSSEAGESIIAFVVPRGEARPGAAELAAHCRALASSYKVPDRFEILDALPTTVTGKVMRRNLKEAAARLMREG